MSALAALLFAAALILLPGPHRLGFGWPVFASAQLPRRQLR